MKNGIELIAEERQRQITEEGWTTEHDVNHTNGQLASAAACYAMTEDDRKRMTAISVRKANGTVVHYPMIWPWEETWWKPAENNRIKDLVRAGALIAAEIDRLQRLEK